MVPYVPQCMYANHAYIHTYDVKSYAQGVDRMVYKVISGIKKCIHGTYHLKLTVQSSISQNVVKR